MTIQLQVHCDEFISLFEEQYPSHAWADIQVQCIYTGIYVYMCSITNTSVRVYI